MFNRTKAARNQALAELDIILRELRAIRDSVGAMRGISQQRCVRALNDMVADYERVRRELMHLV